MSGLEILQAIHALRTAALDQFMYVVTQLHHETFYILVLPLLFWLFDKRFARYMVSVFLLGYWANNVLKDWFHTPRPTAEQVAVLHPETASGYAFPSGHAMNPLMFWGALAVHFRKTWFTVLVAVLVFLIGFSRLYLGLHWPVDVIGGWAIGAIVLYGFVRTMGFWAGDNMSAGARLFWAVVIPLGALGIAHVTAYDELPKDVWLTSGAYLGIWVGTVLEDQYVKFNPRQGGLLAQVVKVLVGLALLFAVKEGFKLFLPETGMGDLIRYAFVGLAATFAAPAIFKAMAGAIPGGRAGSRAA